MEASTTLSGDCRWARFMVIKSLGKPDAGNPHVRFEEGEGHGPPYSTVSFVKFGAPGQAWPILQPERRLPCQLLVQQVATRAASGAIRLVEAPPSERASRNASEPVSAS